MPLYKPGMLIVGFVLFCGLHLTADATTTPSSDKATPSDPDSCPVTLKDHQGESSISPSISKANVALLLLLGFGGFSLLIAGGYKSLRKYVFHDDQNFDTVFDAGGQVSFSLTAVTVTSQSLWPAAFLQMSTLISKSGLGGTLWFSSSIVVMILLFPMLSIYLKTRAPGAKTFPQIAYARFGRAAHILFCIFALFCSAIVITSLLLVGKSALQVLGKDTNSEFIFLIFAVLFGSYCMTGGLGTTFYVSYFNTALSFLSVTIYVLYTNVYPSEEIRDISSVESLYRATSCIKAPDGNYDNTFLTFRTTSAIIYGVVNLFMGTSLTICDQAVWQSRIAAKPSQGIAGFFLAAFLYFAIPMALPFSTTLTYFSLSAQNGTHLLSLAEIDNGYITPFVMNHLLGQTGAYLLLTMLMMTLMSTGSGEVMAVSSVIIYDIYKTYINPFRKGLSPTSCILCGSEKIPDICVDKVNLCQCPSSIDCKACEEDLATRAAQGIDGVQYECSVHGKYRRYEDGLIRYKSWCMVWVVVCIVPYGLLVTETGMNVHWATLGIPALTSSFLWPLYLTTSWSKATSQGVVAGGIIGTISSITGMLVMGSMYEGGLSNFFVNTGEPYSLLASMISGFMVSGVICVGVSLCTHKIKSEADAEMEWAKTINIDNPLNPFRLVYAEELAEVDAGQVITAKTMDAMFRKVKIYNAVGAIISLVIFLVIIPAAALSFEILDFDQFSRWMKTIQIYCFICTVFVVVFPPFEECVQIWRRFKKNKAKIIGKDRKQSGDDVFNSFTSERL